VVLVCLRHCHLKYLFYPDNEARFNTLSCPAVATNVVQYHTRYANQSIPYAIPFNPVQPNLIQSSAVQSSPLS